MAASALRVLLVDDEPDILQVLRVLFQKEGCEVYLADSGEAGLEVLRRQVIDLACIDLRMPGMGGMEFLRRLRAAHPEIEALVLTGYGSKEDTIGALRAGASDFLEKPFDPEHLRHRVRLMRRKRMLQDENRELHALLRSPQPRHHLIGRSRAIEQVRSIIARVKDDDGTVLIQGESGTGKEQVARAIHYGGKRADKPFVAVDCGALNPNLIESELFGHKKGSFTGADVEKLGLMEAAGEGTLFIDEIIELTPQLQAKLLRAIQEREFRPVGATASVPLRARILAASRKELEGEVKSGRMREDLYYRLNVVEVVLPPLRERRDDIPLLVHHFLEKLGAGRRKVDSIEPAAVEALEAYAWPGNVRELEHAVERALVFGSGTVLRAGELPPRIQASRATGSGAADDADRTLAAAEKRAIRRVLEETGGNKRQAARILDISVNTLYEKIRRYGLSDEPSENPESSKRDEPSGI